MTRFAWIGILLAGALSSGCFSNNFVAPDKTASKPLETNRIAEPAPVVAAQITTDNAQEKAQALRAEINRDLDRAIDASDSKPDKK